MLTESQLILPREKPRHLWLSIAYKILPLIKLIGKTRALKFFANLEWLSHRFAFEIAGEMYGDDFYSTNQALTTEFLRKYTTGSTVIDVGCAYGRWTRELTFAKEAVGIDLSLNHITKARKECPDINFILGDVTTDLSGRFDFALLSHVLEHIEDSDDFLTKLHNTADNLIIEVPDIESPMNLVRVKLGCTFYNDADHVREYTRDILVGQLERTGWKVVECVQRNRAILVVATS